MRVLGFMHLKMIEETDRQGLFDSYARFAGRCIIDLLLQPTYLTCT